MGAAETLLPTFNSGAGQLRTLEYPQDQALVGDDRTADVSCLPGPYIGAGVGGGGQVISNRPNS